jgi:hypothetical protein
MQALIATEAGAEANEDWCLAAPGLAIVLDGLSSPPAGQSGCRHGTGWYVRALGGRLAAVLVGDDSISPAAALAETIGHVADLHRTTCDLSNPGTPSATVALLRLNRQRDQWEYLVLADSVVVLDLPDGVQVISDHRVEHAAAAEQAAIADHPIGSVEHQLSITRLIAAQRKVRNQPGGYWVAGTNPTAADHALTGTITASDLRRAAVLSDGASRLVDQYERATWTELLDVLDHQGPAELIRRVRELDAADPHGQQWARYKVSDDATAIYLRM